jgi:G:T-mismatch repair DNA endonuclease (very short patch repair protein)
MKRVRTTSQWQVAPEKKLRIAGTMYVNSTGTKTHCDKRRKLRPACIFDDCEKRPGYGNPLDKSATYCSTHKQDGMENIVSKRCLHDGCTIQPSYGHPLDKSATYCVTHMQDGMKDIANKRCLHDGCKKQPSYGNPLDKSATYCVTHKQDGMEDIVSKRCLHDGCDTIPVYGHPLDKSATYCVTHKQDDMENIANKRCLHDGCGTRPSYGNPLDNSATYCVTHKNDDMEDIANKRCLHDGCDTRPSYGNPLDNSATYCVTHKQEGMEDIVNKRCTFTLQHGVCCSTQAVNGTNLCTVHQPGYVKAVSGYSKISCEFMDLYADKHGVVVEHAHYDTLTGKICGREHRVVDMSSFKSGCTKVDGYIRKTKTILEFHGDYYHGNPRKYSADEWNETTKCTFGALYENTMERMHTLRNLGYTVLYVWENDFRVWKKTQSAFDQLPVTVLSTVAFTTCS